MDVLHVEQEPIPVNVLQGILGVGVRGNAHSDTLLKQRQVLTNPELSSSTRADTASLGMHYH